MNMNLLIQQGRMAFLEAPAAEVRPYQVPAMLLPAQVHSALEFMPYRNFER